MYHNKQVILATCSRAHLITFLFGGGGGGGGMFLYLNILNLPIHVFKLFVSSDISFIQ